MDRSTFFSSLIEFPYFTREQLRVAAEKFIISETTCNSYISKSLRDAETISLKKNYYVTRNFYDKHKTDTSYLFFLANSLLKPSYVSLQAALQYYGIFAEAVQYTVTSVTIKLPRTFMNRTGRYSYRNITESLFTGFTLVKSNFDFMIALPHKAIFDYLYYHTNRFTKNVHPDLLEELRIDTDSLSAKEKENLKKLLKKFTTEIRL